MRFVLCLFVNEDVHYMVEGTLVLTAFGESIFATQMQ